MPPWHPKKQAAHSDLTSALKPGEIDFVVVLLTELNKWVRNLNPGNRKATRKSSRFKHALPQLFGKFPQGAFLCMQEMLGVVLRLGGGHSVILAWNQRISQTWDHM